MRIVGDIFMWEHEIFKQQSSKLVVKMVMVMIVARMRILIERDLLPLTLFIIKSTVSIFKQEDKFHLDSNLPTQRNQTAENPSTCKCFLWRCFPSSPSEMYWKRRLRRLTLSGLVSGISNFYSELYCVKYMGPKIGKHLGDKMWMAGMM